MPSIKSLTSWGLWSFDPSRLALVLQVAGSPKHSIDLRTMTSSTCLLDSIFEVNEKEWANNEIVADLIAAFQDLFDPRVSVCRNREARTFDPIAHLKATIH